MGISWERIYTNFIYAQLDNFNGEGIMLKAQQK